MKNQMTHKGFQISKISNFEFKVTKGNKTQEIGGLSNIENIKMLIDNMRSEKDFFSKH